TGLVAAVRQALDVRASWAHTAQLVADQLRAHLPGPHILTPDQRRGDPDRPAGHLLHAEPDGTFSILGLIWRPGQSTRIHDHITWCVVGVLAGTEQETLSHHAPTPMGEGPTPPGGAAAFPPPGNPPPTQTHRSEPPFGLHTSAPDTPGGGSGPRRYYS